MSKLLNVSSSPHVRCGVSTKNLMYDVAIAMLPATIWGVMQFGIYSLIVVVATVLSCVLSEYLFETLMHKPVTISDGSALVTGMILGLNMPPAIPLWMPILGGVFAIIVVKQLYGGLGQNWMNPALAARCFMLISFAQAMTKFTDPVTDAVASATPLAAIKAGDTYDLAAMFIGKIPGTIGEVSVIALLIGAAYLLVKKVITIRIPAAYILSFAVFAFIFGQHNINYVLAEVCGGGLIFGAFFMATDYVTSPTTTKGKLVFGIGLGIITCAIRFLGRMNEGVSFAILLMNLMVPYIEVLTRQDRLGIAKVKKSKEGAAK